MWSKLLYNLQVATDAIAGNKMRAALTSLGIVFGVASVITMIAIGKGTEEEILQKMVILGARNVIIKPVIEQKEEVVEDGPGMKEEKHPFTPGLTMKDAHSIAQIVPGIEMVSPEIEKDVMILRNGRKRTSKLVGVMPSYFEVNNLPIGMGSNFTDLHIRNSRPVCIIGNSIMKRFFPGENPIGKRIKCGSSWLTVVGVLKESSISDKYIKSLGLRDYNLDIYVPATTTLLRYVDRSKVTREDIELAAQQTHSMDGEETEAPTEPMNYHQLDRLVIRVADGERMLAISEIIDRMLKRRHNTVVDYQIIVPEQLLKQEQETKERFKYVLISIATISLLVGGIGIMNIMLASIMERIKEIGLRLSVGATQSDIKLQFLSEAVMISLAGGIIGILGGITLSLLIQELADVRTIVSGGAILLSFLVSFTVGIIFGYFPARKAAIQDPIKSLRYE